MRPAAFNALCIVVLAFAMAGCDFANQMKEGMAHSSAAASSIEKQAGKKPFVGFNYNNGVFTQATVQFAEPPTLPLPELEKIVRAAVVQEFQAEPSSLVIAFSYPKTK